MAGSQSEPVVVRSGFELFFRDRFDGVARAAALVAGDRGSGQDLAQEAFLRLFERWESMGSDDHARNFVFKVAINLARSQRRRHLRLVRSTFVDEDALEAPDRTRPDEWDDVMTALAALSYRQRSCVVLIDLVDMDAASAATTLGINVNTVRVHLMRGRQALRKALGVAVTEGEVDEA